MTGLTRSQLEEALRRKIVRPVFAVLTGDHLTGVARQEAAYSLQGAMLVPARNLLGLRPTGEVKERQVEVAGFQVQLRFPDLRPCLDQLASPHNTRVLEVVFSPHVVLTGPEHEHLRRIARPFMTKGCFHDFSDRARAHREALAAEGPVRVFHLLEAARLYLCGMHALGTGQIESDLRKLLAERDELWLRPFLQRQAEQGASAVLEGDEARLTEYDLARLEQALAEAHEASSLPDAGGSISSLDEFLVEMRLAEIRAEA